MQKTSDNKLAIGTVQFGLSYGISNQSGQVDFDEASAIVDQCRHQGIQCLDTAIAYGNAESVLGQIGIQDFEVVTKLPAVPERIDDIASWMVNQVSESLDRLNMERLHGLLLHNAEQLFSKRGSKIWEALCHIKNLDLANKIGISVYAPKELDELPYSGELDLVQLPLNVLDRRMEQSGWLGRLNQQGTEVHSRSAFLQGLLLMGQNQRPKFTERWADTWEQWTAWLDSHRSTALQACIQYPQALPEVSRVVVGVTSKQELLEIVKASQAQAPSAPVELSCDDVDLINPARWPARSD